jgi:hypothetical protein
MPNLFGLTPQRIESNLVQIAASISPHQPVSRFLQLAFGIGKLADKMRV